MARYAVAVGVLLYSWCPVFIARWRSTRTWRSQHRSRRRAHGCDRRLRVCRAWGGDVEDPVSRALASHFSRGIANVMLIYCTGLE